MPTTYTLLDVNHRMNGSGSGKSGRVEWSYVSIGDLQVMTKLELMNQTEFT